MAIDWASMTDEELEQELNLGHAEMSKRRDLTSIPDQIEDMNRAYLATTGVTQGDEWRQPHGAFDAYPLDWDVLYEEKMWRSLLSGNVFEPGVAGWRQIVEEGEYLEWVQPAGPFDSYAMGEEVTHDDKYWRSDIDANVWEPPQQWTEIQEGEPPPEPEILPWKQPTGSSDAYDQGDQVTHEGNLWTSLVPANVWEPPLQWQDEGPYTP